MALAGTFPIVTLESPVLNAMDSGSRASPELVVVVVEPVEIAPAGMQAKSPKSGLPLTIAPPWPPFAINRLPPESNAMSRGLSMSGLPSFVEFVTASTLPPPATFDTANVLLVVLIVNRSTLPEAAPVCSISARKLAGGALPVENTNDCVLLKPRPSELPFVFFGVDLMFTVALVNGAVLGVSVNAGGFCEIVNATVPPVPLIVPLSEWYNASLPWICRIGRPGLTIVLLCASVYATLKFTALVPTLPNDAPTGPVAHAAVPLATIVLAFASSVIVKLFVVPATTVRF